MVGAARLTIAGPAAAAPPGPAPDDRLQSDECGRYRPVVEAGKVVFIVEYRDPASAVLGREPRGTSVSLKRLNLDARVTRGPFRPAS